MRREVFTEDGFTLRDKDEIIEVLPTRVVTHEHRGTSKKLLPPADIGQDAAEKLIGQMLDQRHFELLLDETGTIGTPEGGPICTLLKNRIPPDLLNQVRPILRSAAKQSVVKGGVKVGHRGGAKVSQREETRVWGGMQI